MCPLLFGIVVALSVSETPESPPAPVPGLREIADVPAVAGAEDALLDLVEASLPEGVAATRDALGSLLVRAAGDDGPVEQLLIVGAAESGYVVSRIREDGLLRLRFLGSRATSQFHLDREGRPVRIVTRHGEVPGVVMIHSIHLRNERPEELAEHDLYVDVGADSPADVAALGIELLDTVTSRDVIAFGDGRMAGPDLGRRAALHGLLRALQAPDALVPGRAVAFVAQSTLGSRATGRGGEAVLRRWAPQEVIVLDRRERDGPEPQRWLPESDASWVWLDLPVDHAGTPVETVQLADMDVFLGQLPWGFAGGRDEAPRAAEPMSDVRGDDPHVAAAAVLERLVRARGVSGHEDPVRAAVRVALHDIDPTFEPETDTEGNLVLRLGSGDRTLAFVAHMDEVGLEVTEIRADGLLATRTRGGFFNHTWRAKPIELTTANGVLPGIALPEAEDSEDGGPILVDVGARTAGEAHELGVAVGDPVTDPKELIRLGAHRGAGRSLDDRVGCSALLLALRQIDVASLDRELVFAWVVREEIGLEGADVLARTLRPVPEVAFPVDTFVSSDGPHDDPYYAYARLGDGPVLRALDRTSITPRAVLDRVREIAARHDLPMQTGTMGGGNDGSRFQFEGSMDCPLAWPQRNSHTRVETMDLRDLEWLAVLVAAVAQEY